MNFFKKNTMIHCNINKNFTKFTPYFTALLLACVFTSNSLWAQTQGYYFPQRAAVWETKSPAQMGLNEKALAAAIDFAKANEYSGDRDLRIPIAQGFASEPYHKIVGPTKKRGGPAGMILKKGYAVGTWGDTQRVDMTFSVTKSYLATLAGLAHEKGLLPSFSEKVYQRVWDGTFDGTHNQQITWSHLLDQSSDWSGTLWGAHDWADRPAKGGDIDSWKNRALHTPGTHFKYNDVRVNVLAYSLLQLWRKPLPVVLRDAVMDPIGASSSWRWFGYENSWVNVDGQWVQSVSGGGHSGGGLFINTEDHARFGLLHLAKGQWAGQRILSSQWLKTATTPSKANVNYGYMWWLNQRGPRHWEGVPENVYYAAGFGGNFIVVMPEQELVVVVRWLEPSKMATFMSLLMKAI